MNFKKMTQRIMNQVGCPLQLSEDTTSLKIGISKHLIHVAAVYLVIVAAIWCIPACLYHRISETGQAVIVTLVDTASLELQNLAEPRFASEDHARISPSNLSQSTTFIDFDNKEKVDTSSSKLPFASVVSFTTVNLNITNSEESEKFEHQNDEVLVVRAEPKTIDDSTNQPTSSGDFQTNEEVYKDHEETVKSEDDVLSTSGELDQGTLRPKLVPGNSEEAATVILDGFVGSGSSEHHEDIPSFSEWTQKRLEEAEKKKSHPNASIQNPGTPGKSVSGMKVRSKNYASPDCGAKIVAVNPEARSARSVLVATRDEYMLNTCTSRIWFVVELCEAIQAKKIELANFELFSSSPKDFTIFVSDRFPTREWSPVGQFTAKDERDIQSFTLHPHLFGKFIKFELHSHYGSEHFCPISLFRTYGTSEFEVLETETDVQESSDDGDDDDDDDQVLDGDSDDSSKNLFGSARDVVIRIVKKAAEVLVQSGDSGANNITKIRKNIEESIQDSFKNCMTPRFTILCNNCTDDEFAKVFQLLSCRTSYFDSILKISFFSQIFHQNDLCDFYGIDFASTVRKDGITSSRKRTSKKFNFNHYRSMSFLTSIFSTEYVVAFCNVLIARDRKLALNTTGEANEKLSKLNTTPDVTITITESSQNLHKITTNCVPDGNCKATETSSNEHERSKLDSAIREDPSTYIIKNSRTSTPAEIIKISETIASQIKPTKTLSKENIKRESSVPILEPSKDVTEETIQADAVTTPSPLINSAITSFKVSDEPSSVRISAETTAQMTTSSVSNIKCEVNGNTESLLAKNDGESVTYDTGSSVKVEEKEDKSKEKDNDDIKLMSQDQLSLDSLLSDLKDLENDSPAQGSSSSTVTHSVISTPQQKESVFLRLSNRIKALERNMSLSSQYLEELSRRYKKQVEEMQRSLERATVAMGEEFKKSEERELKRLEEIAVLREVVSSLTLSVETLLYDKNSWRSKLSTFGQHIALIFIEITIFILIISYCRRSSDQDISITNKSVVNREILRRKSAESMSSPFVKTKRRRPSEIASRITGSYKELMINEKSELKREKRKKRKKDSLRLSSNIELKKDITNKLTTSRRSFTDCSYFQDVSTSNSDVKQKSVPDSSVWFNQLPFKNGKDSANDLTNSRIVIEEVQSDTIISPELNDTDEFKNSRRLSVDAVNQYHNDISKNNSPRGLSIFRSARLHSPSFMKTALRARSKREKSKSNESQSAQLISDNWEWYSRTSESSRSEQDSPLNINSHNGDISNSNEHDRFSESVGSENSSLSPVKKVKKEGSLRKMVKKLF